MGCTQGDEREAGPGLQAAILVHVVVQLSEGGRAAAVDRFHVEAAR